MARQKKKEMFYSDGQLDERPEPIVLKTNLRNVDELWGSDKTAFGTMDEAEYTRRLNDKTIIDLQRECVDHGLHPKDSKERMTNALIGEFRKYIQGFDMRTVKPIEPPSKLSPRAQKILSEGANKLR